MGREDAQRSRQGKKNQWVRGKRRRAHVTNSPCGTGKGKKYKRPVARRDNLLSWRVRNQGVASTDVTPFFVLGADGGFSHG